VTRPVRRPASVTRASGARRSRTARLARRGDAPCSRFPCYVLVLDRRSDRGAAGRNASSVVRPPGAQGSKHEDLRGTSGNVGARSGDCRNGRREAAATASTAAVVAALLSRQKQRRGWCRRPLPPRPCLLDERRERDTRRALSAPTMSPVEPGDGPRPGRRASSGAIKPAPLALTHEVERRGYRWACRKPALASVRCRTQRSDCRTGESGTPSVRRALAAGGSCALTVPREVHDGRHPRRQS
jgi:hypothetical protein